MINLIELKKRSRNQNSFTDERYFEIKFKLQFITSIGAIIITVFGYIGYENYNAILIKTDELNNKLSRLDNQINDYDKKIETLNLYSKDIEKIMGVSKSDLKSLNATIANIRDKNVLDKNFYFIDNLSLLSSNELKKIYFKDLVTSYGDRLPIFTIPPTIIVAPSTGGNFFINKITNEYVELGIGSSVGIDDDKFPFTLIISKRK
ncbi:hypothetical protein B0A72_11010 [Flavobacterium pectinovorum]|nr:hypothetical protein B0A72_11010 [Flavobacterium pectinovorum]